MEVKAGLPKTPGLCRRELKLQAAAYHGNVYVVVVTLIGIESEVVEGGVDVQAFDGLVDVGQTEDFHVKVGQHTGIKILTLCTDRKSVV